MRVAEAAEISSRHVLAGKQAVLANLSLFTHDSSAQKQSLAISWIY